MWWARDDGLNVECHALDLRNNASVAATSCTGRWTDHGQFYNLNGGRSVAEVRRNSMTDVGSADAVPKCPDLAPTGPCSARIITHHTVCRIANGCGQEVKGLL